MQEKKTIQSIQALRGIAAILVMFYHKKDTFIIQGKNYGECFFGAGAMGVDLFFILSGFIMMMISKNNSPQKLFNFTSVIKFWINRFTRIIPLYFIVTILFYLSVWRGFNFLHDPVSLNNLEKTFLFIPLNGRDIAPFYGYAAMSVGWTLNYEMFFYGLFGISLLFGKWRWYFFIGLMLCNLILIPTILKGYFSLDAMHHYHFTYGYLNLITNPINLDFLLGILIGFLIFRNNTWKIGKIWSFICLILSFIYVVILYVTRWDAMHGITRWATPIAIFLFFVIYTELNYGLRVPIFLSYLGKLSYSIYLIHLMMQYWTRSLFVHTKLSMYLNTPLYLIVASIFTIIIAIIFQYLIENKLSNYLKQILIKLCRI
ncbi:acyltransferase family protein [Rhizosphaericola mali]|uniref:Acyltransferase n=1 Tax=Rhizosphaericola mali TaxID=2545455 RepID=A0A5P2G2S0_9BACT|nr:acyltransferase [Rhizosphaericola mali]QES89785.1 acyltransferase [Rhizosphaericola mali]